MTFVVGIVIIGGIRRIAATAEKIVPFMCGIYVAACLFILLENWSHIPAAFSAIIQGAFTPEAGYGGFLGVLIQGFRRAAFSNEAGVGSAAIAHSAAKTRYPVREGIVALLEPFIDTVVVCTMTALVIVITEAYKNPAYADLIARNEGGALTSNAMGEHIHWFPYVLSISVVLVRLFDDDLLVLLWRTMLGLSVWRSFLDDLPDPIPDGRFLGFHRLVDQRPGPERSDDLGHGISQCPGRGLALEQGQGRIGRLLGSRIQSGEFSRN